MNWFYSLVVFQFTILLLHARPETSSSTGTPTTSSHEQITLKLEHHSSPSPSPSPSSVPSIVLQTSGENGPSSPATVVSDSTKQSSTTAAASTPVQTTKRVLTTVAQVKKVPPTKKAVKIQETTPSASTVASSAQRTTAKTTRYIDKHNHNHTHSIMHANVTAKYFNNTSNHSNSSNNDINNNNNNNDNSTKISNLRELRQQHVSGLNRQYLGNVYNVNPYLTQLVTTPKTVHTFLSSAPQQTYFIVHPNDIANFDPQLQNNINLAQLGSVANVDGLGNLLNVGNAINTNVVSTLSATESYQIPRPPPEPQLTVNIPYHEFPTPSSNMALPPVPQTPPLFHSANITKLYSIIGTSTPDPYTNFQQVPLRPSVYGQKVVKFSVTTHRPYKSNSNRYGNGQNKRRPIQKNQPNFNHNNGNNGHFNSNQVDNNQNTVNKISIVYNESSQFINANNNANQNSPVDNSNSSAKNESFAQTKPKECLVTPNTANGQAENVCNSNDLKIIIKFDGSSIANATEKNAVKSKPKKRRKTVIMTTSTSTAATAEPFYDSLSYASDETSEESNELSGIFEPLQNIFGLMETSSVERRPGHRHRRRRKKPQKEGHKHKKSSEEVINKYQTIILQTPTPPTTTATPMKSHKSLLYKFFAILSMIALLKPLGFGLWTLVLSPLLVIVTGGVALGVILYPFLAISKKQQIHYASSRSPRIVIHKHPRPAYARPAIQKPIPKRPVHPSQLGPGYVVAKWHTNERRRIDLSRNTHSNAHKMTHNHRRRQQLQPRRIPIPRNIPIRSKTRPRRHARDTEFQQWLLVQNNFNIRIMAPNHDYDYDY